MHYRAAELAGQVIAEQRQAGSREPIHPPLIAGYCVRRGVDEGDTGIAS
jgi:hypothetical protein